MRHLWRVTCAAGVVALAACQPTPPPPQTEPDGGAPRPAAPAPVRPPAAPAAAEGGGLDLTLLPGERRPEPLNRIRLPRGFAIDWYASEVPAARSLALGDQGTLFVGTRKDRVYAVVDRNRDGRADAVHTIATGLNEPNGVAVRDGDLYVAEIGRVLRFPDIEQHLPSPPRPQVVTDQYPEDRHHGWKFIRFGPDGLLYVPIGAPCNICDRGDPYASITRIRPDGSGFEIIARGIRNTVGFDWHPETGELWFTENGRDHFGDDRPPDELNRVTAAGQHFGYPYFHGKSVRDPEFGQGKEAGDYVEPEAELGPHVAALGMRFYTGAMFPAGYRNQMLIAEHGSWNRSTPLGYRVMLVELGADGRARSYRPFAEGWLQGRQAWGRPVDVLVMPDGALLVSDDARGAIYRITYAAGEQRSR